MCVAQENLIKLLRVIVKIISMLKVPADRRPAGIYNGETYSR